MRKTTETVKRLLLKHKRLALLLGVVALLSFAIAPAAESQFFGGGSGTINQLDQFKATTSPYAAITTNVHAKNLYVPYSWATTSGSTATTFCLTGDSCITSWPSGGPGASSAFEIATTTNIAVPQLAYFTKAAGMTTLGSVATTSLTATSPLSLSQPISVIGSSASALSISTAGDWTGTLDGLEASAFEQGLTAGDGLTRTVNDFDCDTASGSVFGCLTSTDWNTFNSKLSAAVTAIGPTGQTADGPTVTLATTSDTNIGLTITASGDTLTFTSNWIGTLANARLTNSTISGIALGSNLAAHTNDATLSGSSYNGSAAISDWGIDLANPNSWTGLQQFSRASTTMLSSYGPSYFGATATSSFSTTGVLTLATDLAVSEGGTGASTLTGLLQGNGTGAITGGATINNGNWSGTDLSVANGGTGLSTFGGTNRVLYTSAADTLASEAAFTYDQSLDRLTAVYASSTASSMTNLNVSGISVLATLNGAVDAGGATSFEIPNGTAGVIDAIGEITLDTTANQLVIATSTSASFPGVIPVDYNASFSYSTTTTFTGTTTIPLGPADSAETWIRWKCFTDASFVAVVFHDGTNNMNYGVASTTVGTVALGTNASFTAGEKRYVSIGTTTTATTRQVSCTITKRYDRQ